MVEMCRNPILFKKINDSQFQEHMELFFLPKWSSSVPGIEALLFLVLPDLKFGKLIGNIHFKFATNLRNVLRA